MNDSTKSAVFIACILMAFSGSVRAQVAQFGRAAGPNAQQYSLVQAMSDGAQLHTIAFSGVAFLTGDFGASTFFPPGKFCDYFGFQYMRDIDVAGQGHNPAFMNRVAGNVFHVLDDAQKQQFLDLATEQCQPMRDLAEMRFPVIKAFWRELQGDIPAGSSGLSKQSTARYVGEMYSKDAELSYRRAQVYAAVDRSLTSEQKAYLASMKFDDFSTWPALDERDELRKQGRNPDPLFNVAYMTYATDFFSWTAGSVDADTYFCPERHGTYFGGFYMKDMPAMGKRDYNISTAETGDVGEEFIDQVLNADQRACITAIPSRQRADLAEVASVRRQISVELRKFLTGQTPDRAKVIELGRRYGELDGEMSWNYAMAFAKVNKTLTPNQRAQLMQLRNLSGYASAPTYLYSQPMDGAPTVRNTDAFFFAPK
jgi:Spy/CpxP family protein refolding chaperone